MARESSRQLSMFTGWKWLEFGQKSWDVDGSAWHWYLDILAHSSSRKSKLSWIRRRATTLPPTLHRIIQGPRGDISDLQTHVCVSDPKERLCESSRCHDAIVSVKKLVAVVVLCSSQGCIPRSQSRDHLGTYHPQHSQL